MKGYALVVDVTVGALVAIAMLVVAISVLSSGYSSGIGSVAMKRMASDVVATLDYNGTLDTMDENQIRSGIRHLLPSTLEMGMNITEYDDNFNHVKETIVDYSTEKNALVGRHSFMIFSGSGATGFAVADYWVAIR